MQPHQLQQLQRLQQDQNQFQLTLQQEISQIESFRLNGFTSSSSPQQQLFQQQQDDNEQQKQNDTNSLDLNEWINFNQSSHPSVPTTNQSLTISDNTTSCTTATTNDDTITTNTNATNNNDDINDISKSSNSLTSSNSQISSNSLTRSTTEPTDRKDSILAYHELMVNWHKELSRQSSHPYRTISEAMNVSIFSFHIV